jgi:dihydroorotase
LNTLLKNAQIFTRNGFRKQDIVISDRKVLLSFSENEIAMDAVYDLNGLFIIPGFADVHVHLREPGFSYKETIRTGSEAGAHGGYTAVCAMPNLKPVPSTLENLKKEMEIIEKDAVIHVYPYGAITRNQSGRGELGDMEEIAPYVCAFTDDGKGMQETSGMREAMVRAAKLNKMIVAHCEDERELKPGGCIHDGEYARLHHHVGINSASEWKQVKRDVQLAEETGVHYHVCHVSTKESVAIIRDAKRRGVHVTCETGPHYLMFTDMDLQEDGKWKMNPPIRSAADRHALLEGIKDGTIDCIITDHAPHSKDEKSKGLDGSAFGIVGLETSFPALYHNLVLRDPEHPESGKGAITLEKLIELMSVNPRQVFSLPGPKFIEDGADADLTVLDLAPVWNVDVNQFYSMGHSTLFDGMEVQGQVVSTFVAGQEVYNREKGILA